MQGAGREVARSSIDLVKAKERISRLILMKRKAESAQKWIRVVIRARQAIRERPMKRKVFLLMMRDANDT